MKYLLDENLPALYRLQLTRRVAGLTVWMIGDPGAPERGTKDPAILDWCSQYEFVLVTNNRASMPSHLSDHLSEGKQVPGILVFRRKATVKEILEDLVLIAKVADVDEFRDQIVHIPLK
jgi:hypothetical protein